METIKQVSNYLENSGYSEFLSSDRSRRLSVCSLLLVDTWNGWKVYETDRNDVAEIHLETPVGSEAIRLFLQLVSSRLYHLRTYTDAMRRAHLESLLEASNVPFRRWVALYQNRLTEPYENWLSVLVTGKDLVRAQHVAASLDT